MAGSRGPALPAKRVVSRGRQQELNPSGGVGHDALSVEEKDIALSNGGRLELQFRVRPAGEDAALQSVERDGNGLLALNGVRAKTKLAALYQEEARELRLAVAHNRGPTRDQPTLQRHARSRRRRNGTEGDRTFAPPPLGSLVHQIDSAGRNEPAASKFYRVYWNC